MRRRAELRLREGAALRGFMSAVWLTGELTRFPALYPIPKAAALCMHDGGAIKAETSAGECPAGYAQEVGAKSAITVPNRHDFGGCKAWNRVDKCWSAKIYHQGQGLTIGQANTEHSLLQYLPCHLGRL